MRVIGISKVPPTASQTPSFAMARFSEFVPHILDAWPFYCNKERFLLLLPPLLVGGAFEIFGASPKILEGSQNSENYKKWGEGAF